MPLLVGMALTFSLVAVAAAVGGHWVIQLNQGGRCFAMAIFVILGASLIFPSLAERLARPLVRTGGRLQNRLGTEVNPWKSMLLGVSTGLLWAPCAGPILGLILTGAALQGPGARSSIMLILFAAGAATSLGLALFAGSKVLRALKGSLAFDIWFRRALGVTVILGVVAIALGWDTTLLARMSFVNTAKAEERLIDVLGVKSKIERVDAAGPAAVPLSDEGPMPELDGAVAWLNSRPLSRGGLKGKVVLIDFWTYSCINCLRSLPYLEAWAAKYTNDGLVVIGVHTPEFAFEKDPANVKKALPGLGVTYPVAVDSEYKIWQAFKNQYWPAHYFIDAKGHIRYHHFGEGEYDESERVIQELLMEAGAKGVGQSTVSVSGTGVEAAGSGYDVQSQETYVGYERAKDFISSEPIAHDRKKTYAGPGRLSLNQWGLDGTWKVSAEMAVLQAAPGKILFRFHARDLHLVLGPAKSNRPVRFKVKLDGAVPGADRGADVAPDGTGTVQEHRLYQLIRQKGPVEDRTIEIEFLDPGVQAFAFTFG